MPHKCTGCGTTFEDGSKEMLSGCPNCGGHKFQFNPTESNDRSASFESEHDAPEPADPDVSSVAETVGKATTKVRDFVAGESQSDPAVAWPADSDMNSDDESDADIIDADARAIARGEFEFEDVAQERARSDVVDPDELSRQADSDAKAPDSDAGRIVSEPAADATDVGVAELREQLSEQFESIKIVEPGQYELNLMELYDREEYIIALQENGRYVIQVPEQWMGDDIDS